jgi:acetyl-CoA carboxylase biotin carboxylase subunit
MAKSQSGPAAAGPLKFKRILVANRGEIALRVMRTCREMGIDTACVFSEADRGAEYLKLASHAVCIGPPPPGESYLKGDRIIAAAEMVGADAIHPGYGFLAENAQFADMCRDSNIEFIGPSSESIRLLGDKAAARKLAKKAASPPCRAATAWSRTTKKPSRLPRSWLSRDGQGAGRRGRTRAAHRALARRTQARPGHLAAGGAEVVQRCGRLHREVHREPTARRGAALADQKGHVVHLFERDCTVQRRYQKLIEESPSPGIDNRRARTCARPRSAWPKPRITTTQPPSNSSSIRRARPISSRSTRASRSSTRSPRWSPAST